MGNIVANNTTQGQIYEKYNVVRVGNVEPKPVQPDRYVSKRKPVEDTKEYLFSTKCKCAWSTTRNTGEKCKCNVLAYYQNSKITTQVVPAFYSAFSYAYDNHKDIILSPDDVWMIISLQFTRYVNDNAEKMRHMFVNHEGQKDLTVTTHNDLTEDKWEEFFELMLDSVRTNTKDEVVDLLQSDFTTTTPVEKLLSTAVIMNTFKQYFKYGRCIPLCGIRNVLFMGTLDDWNVLSTKLEGLKKYAICSKWTKYVDELSPVITKFIETYEGNVDMGFWDKVMNVTYGSLGSGSTSYVSGWILKFYGIYDQVETCDIKEEIIDVPVKIDNKSTGVIKMVNIVGGFGGIVNETTEKYDAYKPQMSFIVYHDGEILEGGGLDK